MSFPYSYKKSIDCELKNYKHNFNSKNILYGISNIFFEKGDKIIFTETDSLSITTSNSLFRIKYDFDIEILSEKGYFKAVYTVNTEKLIRLTIILVFFSAFFSFFSVKAFLIFASLFSLAFYFINIIIIKSYIESNIKKILGGLGFDFEGSEKLSDVQKEWLNNPDLCPACGCKISIYDINCPDCGLRVKSKKYKSPRNITRFEEKQIIYNVKKPNKE